jgi:hypothetical protein
MRQDANKNHSHLDLRVSTTVYNSRLQGCTVLDQNTVGFTLLGFLPNGLPLRVSTTVWMHSRVYPPID